MLDKRNFYINGKWIKPFKQNDFEVINPSSEDTCAIISLGSKDDVNLAVKAAKESFPRWSRVEKKYKISLIEKLYEIYKSRWQEMTESISLEMGAPLDWSSSAQTSSGASHIKDFIKRLEDFEFELEFSKDSNNYIAYEPIGVCGLITPWNWPINQITLKVIPALATGCTMILKPSEIAPLSGMLFAEMIDEAGFPPGVFNLVNGDGLGVGTELSGHPNIDMISFTGSTRAGKLITKNAGDTIKRVCLELGGKGGNIIFEDSHLDAVREGVKNVMSNSGQSCDAPTRMLVQKSIYERAVKEAADEASKIKVDVSEKKGDHIGPVVSKTQYDKILDLIQSGIDEGATLVADDQVLCRREGSRLYASAPNATRGLLEVRGIGPIRTSYIPRAKICLVVDLVAMNSIQRFPMSRTCEIVGVEILLIELTAFEVSATAKLKLALESVTSGTQFGNNMLS